MSIGRTEASEVSLDASSASHLLWTVLVAASQEFDALRPISLGSVAAFRNRYDELLPGVELARCTSNDASSIATRLCELVQERVLYNGVRLVDALDAPAKSYALTSCVRSGASTNTLLINDVHYSREQWIEAGHSLHQSGRLNCSGLRCLEMGLTSQLGLQGQSFVIMGAGAELAPTRELLSQGARVLWVDRTAPCPQELPIGGELLYAPEGMDLLAAPTRVLATIRAFANNEPVHLACYAYAAGNAREWRLMATMNAIVEKLVPTQVRSVSLLFSPASPNPVSQQDAQAAQAKRECRWRSFGGPPHFAANAEPIRVSNSVIKAQGTSYQAAQYLGKRVWLASLLSRYPTVRCGAVLAGISETESMSHRAFQLAFSMAQKLDIGVYDPVVTRCLCALMTLGRLQLPVCTDEPQLHGGVHRLPYSLSHALKCALVLAVARRPWRAAALLR